MPNANRLIRLSFRKMVCRSDQQYLYSDAYKVIPEFRGHAAIRRILDDLREFPLRINCPNSQEN